MWLDDDAEEALAWLNYKQDLGPCGLLHSETLRASSDERFIANGAECPACRALAAASESLSQPGTTGVYPHAWFYTLEKIGRPR